MFTARSAVRLLSARWIIGIVLIQTIFAGVVLAFSGLNLVTTLVLTLIYFGLQCFAVFSTNATLREREVRQRLERVNAELETTQLLLAESSRLNERTRIARELHDAIGHQLTALSLQLEAASHFSNGRGLEHVKQAQMISKELLSDVREVVSTMREAAQLDVSRTLELMVARVSQPFIHLSLPSELVFEDSQRAHTLLRCVQEIITNTLRHAQAQNLWIQIEHTGSAVAVHARDDGRGVATVQQGNGLRGMIERLSTFGGRLEIVEGLERGFALNLTLPLRAQGLP
jgi:signal transduction histidine kinase